MKFDRRALLAGAGGIFLSGLVAPFMASAATIASYVPPPGARCRVLYVNDLSGDIDGLFASVHLILSGSVELRGIVGSGPGRNKAEGESAKRAADLAYEMLEILQMKGHIPIFEGAPEPLQSRNRPVASPGSAAIIAEAMRTDTSLPLYIAVGGGLTEVASALMIEPKIADRFTLVWIGGGAPHPENAKIEPNFGIDPFAAQYVFNQTEVSIWHVPSEVYQTCVVSNTELQREVAPRGAIGKWLYEKVVAFGARYSSFNTGETYTLGDNPLVALVALNDWIPSAYQAGKLSYTRTGSSAFEELRAPTLDDVGAAHSRQTGRLIRKYRSVDTRLLFGDFFAKLQMINN